jgi:hypothetical protein
MARVAGVAVTSLVSLGGAAAALASSFGQAVVGAGALGIALGSTLLPAVALGIGVFRRFKEQADQAGTAAHALKGAFGDFGQVFDRTLAQGSDAVMRGLAGGLRMLQPMVRSLQGEFTNFGRVVGDAFRTLGAEFASPAWQEFS